MPRAVLLSALLPGLVILAGCWPVMQQPTTSGTPAPVATAAAKPAPAARANGSALAKPTAKPSGPAAKPAASPVPAGAAAASATPAVKPTPPAAGASGAGTQSGQPAVVATSAAAVSAGLASPAAKPAAKTAPSDALGIAASAGSAAAVATTGDAEAAALCGPGAILSTRAGQAAGRPATVAISRVAASYQASAQGQPTFLNDAPYPNHVFTAVIWGSERRQFQPAPEAWQGKPLCVTGPVELYQQRPQIVVSSPSQLRAAR